MITVCGHTDYIIRVIVAMRSITCVSESWMRLLKKKKSALFNWAQFKNHFIYWNLMNHNIINHSDDGLDIDGKMRCYKGLSHDTQSAWHFTVLNCHLQYVAALLVARYPHFIGVSICKKSRLGLHVCDRETRSEGECVQSSKVKGQ